eukprot:SAG31_NODE_22558_length_523_cov_0.636792_1_plen_67_part_10
MFTESHDPAGIALDLHKSTIGEAPAVVAAFCHQAYQLPNNLSWLANQDNWDLMSTDKKLFSLVRSSN